jgi:hypothetical protein
VQGEVGVEGRPRLEEGALEAGVEDIRRALVYSLVISKPTR